VISPWSVQEAYDEAIRAFNLAQRFRVPVILLMDEGIGHLRESMNVPLETRVYQRLKDRTRPPFGEAEVPPMPAFGEGARLLVTGSTHDAWGYRRTASPEAQQQLVERLTSKITNHRDEIWSWPLALPLAAPWPQSGLRGQRVSRQGCYAWRLSGRFRRKPLQMCCHSKGLSSCRR